MRAVDLFCGCGGLSLGFQEAGFEVVLGVDSWEPAMRVYQANFAHPGKALDLSQVDQAITAVGAYRPDIEIGGPPCQDFSSAGKRDENNGRGDLTICFAQIVAGVGPAWFLMENVPRIRGSEKLAEAKRILHGAGYESVEIVLDASLCGVPQQRKRFFLIGHRGRLDASLLRMLEEGLAPKPMTMADYFGDSLGIAYYYRHPRSYARRGIFSMEEPSPTIRGVNRPIPGGYQLHHNDPVTTLAGVRPLTTKERSLVQTFPERFKLEGTRTVLEQVIGNAVPVKLASYVARVLLAYMARE